MSTVSIWHLITIEAKRSSIRGQQPNHIIDADAPSASRVVYNYYGGKERFSNISQAMMDAVDKGDSAQFTEDEILHPQGLTAISHDPRTGLGSS